MGPLAALGDEDTQQLLLFLELEALEDRAAGSQHFALIFVMNLEQAEGPLDHVSADPRVIEAYLGCSA